MNTLKKFQEIIENSNISQDSKIFLKTGKITKNETADLLIEIVFDNLDYLTKVNKYICIYVFAYYIYVNQNNTIKFNKQLCDFCQIIKEILLAKRFNKLNSFLENLFIIRYLQDYDNFNLLKSNLFSLFNNKLLSFKKFNLPNHYKIYTRILKYILFFSHILKQNITCNFLLFIEFIIIKGAFDDFYPIIKFIILFEYEKFFSNSLNLKHFQELTIEQINILLKKHKQINNFLEYELLKIFFEKESEIHFIQNNILKLKEKNIRILH